MTLIASVKNVTIATIAMRSAAGSARSGADPAAFTIAYTKITSQMVLGIVNGSVTRNARDVTAIAAASPRFSRTGRD